MKKLNLITLSLLSLPVFATNFVMVIDKEINDYEVGGFTDSKDDPAWTVASTSCSFDKETSEFYYGVDFLQTESCTENLERIITTTRTYENGATEIISTEKETDTNVLASTSETVQGTHLEDSCKNVLSFNSSFLNNDAVYKINNGSKDYDVYCDMTSNGGGWTMILAQFESDPVTNWNEGIQSDYDPTLTSSKGFALNTSEIPSHTQFTFSQTDYNNMNTTNGYFNYQYTTSDIPLTEITTNSGESYYIHRNKNSFYSHHDPDYNVYYDDTTNLTWLDTLTINKIEIGVFSYSFAFSPNHTTVTYRSYAYYGNPLTTSSQAGAWVLWVR